MNRDTRRLLGEALIWGCIGLVAGAVTTACIAAVLGKFNL